jgi:putative salt-induced outer membrane protein YdiY
VAGVTATAAFEVEDLDGRQHFGALQPGASGSLAVVSVIYGSREIELARVVKIQRVGATFWKRLDGSFDVGASYTSSSELLKLDLTAIVVMTRRGHQDSIDGESTMTRQPEVEDTRRNNLTFGYVRRFSSRWLAFGQAAVEQNRELGFDLRGSVTGGGGRYLLQGRKQEMLAALGLRVNREKPLEGETETHLEAAAALTYDRFSWDFPNVDIYASLAGFAGLDDWGRVRVEVDVRIRRELLSDFSVSLRVYESYDSRPPTEGADRNDYGVGFGLGWTF